MSLLQLMDGKSQYSRYYGLLTHLRQEMHLTHWDDCGSVGRVVDYESEG